MVSIFRISPTVIPASWNTATGKSVALVQSFGGAVSLCDATLLTESELIDECRRVLADDWGTSGGPKSVALTELTITDDVPLFSIVFTDVQIIGPVDDKDRMAYVL
jgi:hypothetical protein